MADTFPTDKDGNLIPDRPLQLQQASRERVANVKKEPAPDFWGMCKNSFDHFANIVDVTYTTIRNSVMKATTATALFLLVAASQSPQIEQQLISSFKDINSEQTNTPPVLRPTRQP